MLTSRWTEFGLDAVATIMPSKRNRPLTRDEIRLAFEGDGGKYGPILSPADLAEILHLSVKTIYEWIAKGRLDGAFRKRGKHDLIWRDRALEILLNGPEWTK